MSTFNDTAPKKGVNLGKIKNYSKSLDFKGFGIFPESKMKSQNATQIP